MIDEWYTTLRKAPWTPPNWVFGVVWTFLYFCMGVSLYIVWTNKKCYPYCNPLTIFFIQLALNLMWTTLFFTLKNPLLAFVDLVLIMGFTLYTMYLFYKINPIATYILIPYISWLCVAFSLNLYIIVYN